jgi:hypothetical protein
LTIHIRAAQYPMAGPAAHPPEEGRRACVRGGPRALYTIVFNGSNSLIEHANRPFQGVACAMRNMAARLLSTSASVVA